jgi:uncharacterized membrane protein
MNPLICIRGQASPGHSYPMTPLHVKNAGTAPVTFSYSVNPGDARPWLKASPVRIPSGASATVPLTLVVPSDAGSGNDYVILTGMGTQFDVRFSVNAAAPSQCVAAGYASPPASRHSVWLGLVLILLIVAIVWLVWRWLGRR